MDQSGPVTTSEFIKNVIREAKAGDIKVCCWGEHELFMVPATVDAVIVTQDWLDDVGSQLTDVKVGDRVLVIGQ